jgi:hypothetical protein
LTRAAPIDDVPGAGGSALRNGLVRPGSVVAVVLAGGLVACGDDAPSSPDAAPAADAAAPVAEAPVRPGPHGTLVDGSGRTVLLRGVNIRAAAVFDEFRAHTPLPPFDAEEDCRVIGEDLGLDQLRLAMSWSLLEPERGHIDHAYVASLLAIAAACDRHGVYTLVDLHQDGFSKYVGEDGAPFWAHEPPLPAEDLDEHNGGHATADAVTQAALAGFFADHDGLVADYARTAAELAALVDQEPGVIGLELMNEPVASPEDLAAFHDQVARAVRARAPGLPIYFEPDATRNVLDFARPAFLGVDRIVYAPHLYTGVFQGNWQVGDDARIADSVAAMLDEAAVNDAPVVITEFGNDPADATGAAWLTAALAALDRHLLSASFWVYEEWPTTCGRASCWGFYDETPVDGASPPRFTRTLRAAAVTLVARAYPRAIAGTLDAFDFDAATRTLTVQLHGAAAGGTHVLAAPDLVYDAGVVVTCDGQAVSTTRRPGRVEAPCAGTQLVLAPAPLP